MLKTPTERHFNTAHRTRLAFESLESRNLLAGDVTASLTDDVLSITGDEAGNSVYVRSAELDNQRVDDGVTSVGLDLTTLASVGIDVVGADGVVTSELPGNEGVGFDIIDSSSFRFFEIGSIELIGGTIDHTGTVTLLVTPTDPGFEAAEVTLGDFSIGLGENGFFVASTVGDGDPLVVFDITTSSSFESPGDTLTLNQADLLVADELASVLTAGFGLPDLSGVDVGDARIDGLTVEESNDFIKVGGWRGTTINDARYDAFLSESVSSIQVNMNGGRDSVSFYNVDVDNLWADLGDGHRNRISLYKVTSSQTSLLGGNGRDVINATRSNLGDTSIQTGGANDVVRAIGSTFGDLDVQTSGGRDAVDILFSRIGGVTSVSLGDGNDRLFTWFSNFSGPTSFDGGGQFDVLRSLFSSYGDGDPTISSFESQFRI